jgi:hypothetical protein
MELCLQLSNTGFSSVTKKNTTRCLPFAPHVFPQTNSSSISPSSVTKTRNAAYGQKEHMWYVDTIQLQLIIMKTILEFNVLIKLNRNAQKRLDMKHDVQ